MFRVRWIGGKGQWLPGIPAMDHDVNTRAEALALIRSGLYAPDGWDPAASAPTTGRRERPRPAKGQPDG